MTNPANSEVKNVLPVQAYFNIDGSFNTFIGQGLPFVVSATESIGIINTTVDGTFYPTFSPVSTGQVTTLSVTSPSFTFNPSTGVLTAPTFSGYLNGDSLHTSNITGGASNQLVYQITTGQTGFISNGTTGQVLTATTGSAPSWTTPTFYASVTDDTTTNATRYPLFANTTSGSLVTEYTSSTKYQYNPSTGTLTASIFSGSGALLTNIPNSALTNSSFTLGSTSIALGSTTTTIAGLSSVTSTAFVGALTGNASTATTATTATNATNIGITDNTSSSATWYPTIVSNTTGNLPATTSSTKLSFVPSTGTLTAPIFSGSLGGGATNKIVYQTSANATSFIDAPTSASTYLQWSGSAFVWATASGGGSPGGSNTQVQYNSSGAFAGSANMTFNGTTFTLANDATVSGLTVGLGGGSVNSNTVVGNGAMTATATGVRNSAFGYTALRDTTSGSNNNAFGRLVLASNTIGYENAGFGGGVSACLANNLSGSQNSAFGNGALGLNVSGNANSALGYQALVYNTASNNTAVGYQAGYSNTSGTQNIYYGYQSGYSSTGSYLTALGYQAGYSNTESTLGNTFVGRIAGYSNTTGGANIALGGAALNANSTGSYNTAIGQSALVNNVASNNTAVGYQAGYSNTSGTALIAFGAQALYSNTTGSYNTALGTQVLYYNTSGASNNGVGASDLAIGVALQRNTTGNNNNAFGNGALSSNTTGNDNTAFGHQALLYNTTSGQSTAVGRSSLLNSTGANNTALGYQAGYGITSGTNNVIIGSYQGSAAPISATGSNYIVLSDGAGNVRQTINSAGKVGINTTSPNEFLEVAGNVRVNFNGGAGGYYIVHNGTAITTYIGIGGSVSGGGANDTGFRNDTGNMLFSTGGSAAQTMRISYAGGVSIGTTTDAGATNLLVAGNITAAGNVGIGTTSPTANYCLDAVTNVNAQGGIKVSNTNAGTATLAQTLYSNGTNTSQVGIAGTGYTTYGVITANSAFMYVGGGNTLALAADGSTGIITFGTGGGANEKMRLLASGALSFGASGTAYGTSGQVLTSAGASAVPTWTTPTTGTVTSVSVTSANGFAGTSSGGATPSLTLTTSITGILKGNATAISAATAGTDYSAGTSANTSGLVYSTTTTGALTTATGAQVATALGSTNISGSAANVTGIVLGANGGTGVANTGFTFTMAGNVSHAGAFTQTFTATGNTSVTLPTTGTLSTLAGTETLTNKWVQSRVLASTANSATPTLNTDNYDMMVITGQTVAITNFSTNLTGTPVNGQKLWIAITGTGAIAITWGTSFESSTVTLPSTTVTTARLDVGFVWNVATSKWRCVATA